MSVGDTFGTLLTLEISHLLLAQADILLKGNSFVSLSTRLLCCGECHYHEAAVLVYEVSCSAMAFGQRVVEIRTTEVVKPNPIFVTL